MLPLSIKQQRTRRKSSEIQGQVKEIQKKYKGDQQRASAEIMALYKREKMSPFGGCLQVILQFVLIFAMFTLVRNPLTYMRGIDAEGMENFRNYIARQVVVEEQIQEEVIEEEQEEYMGEEEISEEEGEVEEEEEIEEERDIVAEQRQQEIIEELRSDSYPQIRLIRLANERGMVGDSEFGDFYINMEFFGLNLSNVLTEDWRDPAVYIIPALFVISSTISIRLTMAMNKKRQKGKDKKEIVLDENGNPKPEEPDMMEQMNKSMMWMMPIMSVTIAVIAPLGLALYWLTNNVVMIIEILCLNKFLFSKEDQENGGQENV